MSKFKATFFDEDADDLVSGIDPVEASNKMDIPLKIRKGVSEMFEGFIMTKTHAYTPDPSMPFGIYKALVDSLITGGEQFIIAFVPNDNVPLGSQRLLSGLKWSNFQTRTTTNMRKEFNQFQLDSQVYKRPNVKILNDIIKYYKCTKTSYLYKCENLPLKVELIPTKADEVFAERGTVQSALDLFCTSITMEN